MGEISYPILGRRGRRWKGIRLNCRRISNLRLRTGFVGFITVLSQFVALLKNNGRERSGGGAERRRGSGRGGVAREGRQLNHLKYQLQPYRPCASTLYAEAIADCLEFIKKSSMPEEGGLIG